MPRRTNDNLLVGLLLLVSGWTLALGGIASSAVQAYYFAAGLSVVVGLNILFGVGLPGRPTMFTELLVAAPFAIWFRYMPSGGFTGLAPIDLLFMFGFYSLTLGAHHLLSSRSGGSRLQAMAAAIIAMTLAGTAPRNAFFFYCVCLFVPLILLELRRSLDILSLRLSRGQVVRLGSALAVLLALTAGVQYLVTVQLPPLNRWLTQRFEGSVSRVGGFSRVSHLGNIAEGWNRGNEQQVVLRQFSDRPASHLRAMAFDRYKAGAWDSVGDDPRELRPRSEDAGRHVFDLSPSAAAEYKPDAAPIASIYPEPELTDEYFIPLGARRLSTYSRRLLVTRVLTVRSPERLAAGGYGVYEPQSDLAPPGPNDLEIPADIRGTIREITLAALASTRDGAWPESASQMEIAAGIAAYFKRDFTYHIGLELTKGKDPVVEFLTDIKSGHCEYFAASGVLMLRSMGVPARYVTGFVCIEPGLGNAYHIARRKDAHAWVELYVPGRGWTTFDPTPPTARPSQTTSSFADQLADRVQSYWRRIWSVAAYGGIIAVISMLWTMGATALEAVPLAAWVVILVAGMGWIFRFRLRALFGLGRVDPETPRVRDLRLKLAKAEKLLRRHGVERPPSTAVGVFLAQVRGAELPAPVKEQAVGLLSEFQELRYRAVDGER